MAPRGRKNSTFTPEEDDIIVKLKTQKTPLRWEEISKHTKGKTAKQCCDRYNQYLRISKKRVPWTQEEDEILLRFVKENGHCWKKAESLLSRDNVDIKKRWYNKLNKEMNHHKVQSSPPPEEIVEEIDFTNLFGIDLESFQLFTQSCGNLFTFAN